MHRQLEIDIELKHLTRSPLGGPSTKLYSVLHIGLRLDFFRASVTRSHRGQYYRFGSRWSAPCWVAAITAESRLELLHHVPSSIRASTGWEPLLTIPTTSKPALPCSQIPPPATNSSLKLPFL